MNLLMISLLIQCLNVQMLIHNRCNSFLISAHPQCGNLKVQMEEHELGSDAGGSSSGSTSSLLSDLLNGQL